MSNAEHNTTFVAALHPLVISAAQAIGRSGTWHMSNAYRPKCPRTRTHNLGISLDVAPYRHTRGGFWLTTADLLLRYIQRATGYAGWVSIAELDHVHLSVSDTPAIGVNVNNQTLLIHNKTKQRLRIKNMSHNGLQLEPDTLPEGPIGDILHGDLALTAGDMAAGDLLSGDLVLGSGDAVDTRLVEVAEHGDPFSRSRAVSRLTALPKTQKAALVTDRALKNHRMTAGVPYILVSSGASVRKSSIGKASRMSPAEAGLIRDDLYLIPQVDPTSTTVPLVGADFVLNLNAQYAALFPTLPVGDRVRYVGSILVITANALRQVPDIAANVTVALGSDATGITPFTLSLTVQLSPKQRSTRVYVPIAALSQSRARLVRPFISLNPALVAPAAAILTVSGIPTDYTVTHSFMFLEDSFTNEYTKMLPAS